MTPFVLPFNAYKHFPSFGLAEMDRPVENETPIKSRLTSSEYSYTSGGLEAARDAALKDLCPIPEVDANNLFNAILAKNFASASQLGSTFSSVAEPSFSPVVSEAIIDHVSKKLPDQSTFSPPTTDGHNFHGHQGTWRRRRPEPFASFPVCLTLLSFRRIQPSEARGEGSSPPVI